MIWSKFGNTNPLPHLPADLAAFVVMLMFSVCTPRAFGQSQGDQIEFVVDGVQFVVTNPIGQKTGHDAFTGMWLYSPDCNYKSENTSGFGDANEDVSIWALRQTSAMPGTYRVQFFGEDSRLFSVSISVSRESDPESIEECDSFQACIDSAQSQIWEISFSRDSSPLLSVRRLLTIPTVNSHMSSLEGLFNDSSFILGICRSLRSAQELRETRQVRESNDTLQDVLGRVQDWHIQGPDDSVGIALIIGEVKALLDYIPVVGEVLRVPSEYSMIQAAVEAAKSGDSIIVASGTYDEILKVGERDSICIESSGGAKLRGVELLRSHFVQFRGFVISANGTGEAAVTLTGGTDSNADITLDGNEIRNSDKDNDGILIEEGNTRTRIVNNRIHSNGGNGIRITTEPTTEQYLINNTIVLNGNNGVWAGKNAGVSLMNNIISFNGVRRDTSIGGYGVFREPSGGSGDPQRITLLYNFIVGNCGTVYSGESTQDVAHLAEVLDSTDEGNWATTSLGPYGGVASCPCVFSQVFVSMNPLDLHLARRSPAIDKCNLWYPNADVLAGEIPPVDADGVLRPQGNGVDMGAYEAH